MKSYRAWTGAGRRPRSPALALVADVNPQVRLALSADPALRRALAALPRAAAGQLNC